MGEPSNVDANDVVNVDIAANGWVLLQDKTFTVSDFMTQVHHSLSASGKAKSLLLGDGLPCEVLSPGAPWRKGKVKLRLEFCPDVPISPLDDIRQSLQIVQD